MIALILIKLLDLLIDSFYFLIWVVINSGLNWLLTRTVSWLHYRGISFHPSSLVWGFYWFSQALFALSTFVVIVLHAAKDIKNLRSGQVGEFEGIKTKFVDMARQTSALVTCSTLLIGWTLINWASERAFDFFKGNEASTMAEFWHFVGQLVFAAVTLFSIVKIKYDYTTEIYRRLFGSRGNLS